MTVRVKGLNEAIREIQKRGKKAERVIINVLEDTAASIEIDAKQDAPFSIGGNKLESTFVNRDSKEVTLNLKQRIDKFPKNKGLTWKIGVQGSQDFDAYIEFGTGLSAKQILNSPGYTPAMRTVALSFFKTGLGTLRGSPYLFPNYIKHTANLVQELRDKIAKEIK